MGDLPLIFTSLHLHHICEASLPSLRSSISDLGARGGRLHDILVWSRHHRLTTDKQKHVYSSITCFTFRHSYTSLVQSSPASLHTSSFTGAPSSSSYFRSLLINVMDLTCNIMAPSASETHPPDALAFRLCQSARSIRHGRHWKNESVRDEMRSENLWISNTYLL